MVRFAALVPSRALVARLCAAIALAGGLALTTINAQIPGRNVNMVAGTQWPGGDPHLQRQNEPSIAASTRNPLHLLAGSNDYRTVDLPFPMSIDDVSRNLSTVAAALGEPRRAAAWQRRLSGLRRAKLTQQDAIFLGAGGNSIGAQSVEAEWMGLAGLKQRALPGGRASLELLATRPPAVLLRSSYRRSERSIRQTWLEHPLARPKSSRIVEVDGRVKEATVAKSLDKEHGLDDEAIKALKEWEFTPGTKDGKPVPVRIDVEMSFTLK